MLLLHVHQLCLMLATLLAGATRGGGVTMGRQHDWRWVEVLLVTVVMSAAGSGTVGLVFALGHMTVVCGTQEEEVSTAVTHR